MITLSETIFCEPCERIHFIGDLDDVKVIRKGHKKELIFQNCPEHGPYWVGNCPNCGEKLYNKDIC